MWARLLPTGVEIIHAPVEIWTDTIHHSKAIFTDWTAEELFQHLSIVPAVYIDAPPEPGAVAVAETASLQPDNTVFVARTWRMPELPPVPAAVPAPVVTVVTAPGAGRPDELDVLKAQLARLQAGFDAMHAVMDRGTA